MKTKLTKGQERQYQAVRAKFNISRAEFKQFWTDVRKVNRKTKRARADGTALYAPVYSTNLEATLTSREIFRERRAEFRNILRRDWRRRQNIQQREQFYRNIRNILGSTRESRQIIENFKGMSDSEFATFIERNEDIKPIVYDSDPSRYAYFIGLTSKNILARQAEG